MQCANCGADNLLQARFCARCGTPVVVQAPQSEPAPPSAGGQSQAAGGAPSVATVPAEARRRAKLTVFVVGLMIFIVGVVAVIIVSQSRYTLTQTESAVVVQFGEIRSMNSTPGLHFKIPFIQQAIHLDRGLIHSGSPPSEYLTSDEKRIVVGVVTVWRIVDPLSFFIRLNTESLGSARLERLVLGLLRQEIAATPYEVMISAERDAIMNKVKDVVQAQVDQAGWGLQIVEVIGKVPVGGK